MAGLTSEGFTPLTYAEIKARIETKLDSLSPGFDFSPESPDGQLIGIMAFELSQAWSELDLVYRSYDPSQAVGAGLRNIGLISGIVYGAATRSQCVVAVTGTTGTIIPKGSIVSDAAGNKFTTSYTCQVPSSVQVIATNAGPIVVTAGTVNVISSPIAGWATVNNPTDGDMGATAQTEAAFRNLRSRTVLRNYTSTVEALQSRLYELGLAQVSVNNNDTGIVDAIDSTPANAIQVTVHAVSGVTDMEIASTILKTKPAGCETYGTTTVTSVPDTQGNFHTVKFTKATPVSVYVKVTVEYLSDDIAGADEAIKAALVERINSLQVGEDVAFSRLYCLITPYGKAQVDLLEIGLSAGVTAAANIPISATEFAFTQTSFIALTVV